MTHGNYIWFEKYTKHITLSTHCLKGLGTLWILYRRISLVFHNEFSSNGRAGLMLVLSLFAIGRELVCIQWPGWEAKLFSSLEPLHQLVQKHREHCEHFLPPDSRLQLSSQWGQTGWLGIGGKYLGGGRVDFWPPGGRKELVTACRASRRAAGRWPGGASCWLSGGWHD
jgi:hypothetical protein